MKKHHTLLNAKIRGLTSAVLCVVEYIVGEIKPINVYVIAKYDEIDNTLEKDFSLFENMKYVVLSGVDNYQDFLKLDREMSKFNYQSIDSEVIEICGQEIAIFVNNLTGSNLDYLDVELSDLIEYIKGAFYIDSPKEFELRKSIEKSSFNKIFLEELLEKRKENLNMKRGSL